MEEETSRGRLGGGASALRFVFGGWEGCGREGLRGLLSKCSRLPIRLEMRGSNRRPDTIVCPTKRERFMCGVDIRVIEWSCPD